MKKIFTIISLFSLLTVAAGVNTLNAQAISFKNTVHDFGQIVETDGPATCIFEFTNTGDQPLVINNVIPSCGCTSPGYTKEPIAPGAKGEVRATYNPAGRPGPFDKTLSVRTNGTPANITLRIKGVVSPKPVDLKVTHPLNIGGLRLKRTNAPMGILNSDATQIISLETANAENTPVSFSFTNVPEYITVSAEPATLQPKQQGVIRITFDAKKKKDLGYSKNLIGVTQGNQKGNIEVTAVVKENIARLTGDDFDKTPRFKVNNVTHDFGTIANAKAATATVQIINDGKEELIIRNITSECNQLKSSSKNVKIKPGKSANIKFTYTPNKSGDFNCKAYFATNEAGNTLTDMSFKGVAK